MAGGCLWQLVADSDGCRLPLLADSR